MRKIQMNDNVKKIPMLERFAAQSLVDYEGELIFSKEKFAELIVKECIDTVSDCSVEYCTRSQIASEIKQHFGVEE
jgi:hypothetical protein